MLKKVYFQYSAISDAQAEFVANHFDVVCVDYLYNEGTHTKIKVLNPNIPLLNYQSPRSTHENYPDWSVVDQHEDWFLHSTDGNTREHRLRVKPAIPGMGAGAYQMDISKLEYQSHFAQKCQWVLGQHSEFAGLFFDGMESVWSSWFKNILCTDFDPNLPVNKVPDFPTFHSDLRTLIAECKATIGNKVLTLNCVEGGCLDYFTVGNADAGIFEGFVHGALQNYAYWPPWGYPAHPQAFRILATSGKPMFALPGTLLESINDISRSLEVAKTCLCLALLAAEDTSQMGFGILNSIIYHEATYIPEMDFDFGSPVESTVQLATDVWKRTFENYAICVNMSASAYTFTHQSKSYVIQPKSSLIIDLALPTKHMLTHITYYGGPFTDATAKFVADHFDVLIGDVMYQGATTVLPKNYNPSILVLSYQNMIAMYETYPDWSEVNSHEDWFLHDVNGARLRHKYYGWYCMNVGNTGWRQHFANRCVSMLQAYSKLDGVFADDVFTELPNWIFSVSPNLVPPQPNWHSDMRAMIQQVKTALGNKLLTINCNDYTGDYLSECDGQMLEGFMHGAWNTVDQFEDTYGLVPLNSLSASGKYIFAQTGVAYDAAQESKMRQIGIYGLAFAYLASNGSKVSYGFSRGTYADVYKSYIPEMDLNIGNPKAPAYQLTEKVWTRDFEWGKVYGNYGETAYVTSEGYTLNAHSGLIISTVKHTLAYQSTPIAVPLTVDGQQLLSGQSTQIEEGKTVTIKVPAEVEVYACLHT